MPTFTHRPSYHGSLQPHPEVHAEFLRMHVGRYAPSGPSAPTPAPATPELTALVVEFIETIKNNDTMDPLLELTFKQASKEDKWAPVGQNYYVHDLNHLQRALVSVLSVPPAVYVAENEYGKEVGEAIGTPIYIVLDLLINTSAAYELFRKKEFNAAMKKLLDGWGKYLGTENSGSNSTLNTSVTGWFGKYGLDALQLGLRGLSFEQTYGVKPEDAQETYKTWDAFFTREILNFKILRPVIVPDLYAAIYQPCESTIVRTTHNVRLQDTFWLKGQNYSLYDMFGGDPHITKESLSSWAPRFIGGSVFQGSLTPEDYHRWHSPIKGTVLATTVLPGAYYAALPDDGATVDDGDRPEGDPHDAMLRSLPWLSHAATRGVIIMTPQDPRSPIDLVGFIGIGMMEVSTIDIRVSQDGSEGKPRDVDAGDLLGMFHFGGSSYTAVVKPKEGYEVVFKDIEGQDVLPKQHRWVNEIIGRVVPVRTA